MDYSGLEKNRTFQDLLAESRAEPRSLQSKRPETFGTSFGRVTTAKSAIEILFLLSILQLGDWQTERTIRTIANKAYAANYQGPWSEVQEYLETKFLDPREFYRIYLTHHNPEEFFGNLLPRSYYRMKYFRKDYDLLKEGTTDRKVTRKIRHRGYRDHGTLRLPHEFHGDPIPSKYRIDRRGEVANLLVADRYRNRE